MDVVIVVWSEPLPASLDMAMEMLRRMRSVSKGERTSSFHEPVWAAWGYGATDTTATLPPQLTRPVVFHGFHGGRGRRSSPGPAALPVTRIARYVRQLVWRIWTRSALSH
jgi:hypothetical protein